MSRGFVCSRSNWDEVNCGFFRRGETRYLSARENGNSSEKNENLDDDIHNFAREMKQVGFHKITREVWMLAEVSDH